MADRVVIMSRGHIAQIGMPKDIYRAPENRFVAEFVGRNNIISGTRQINQLARLVTIAAEPWVNLRSILADGHKPCCW